AELEIIKDRKIILFNGFLALYMFDVG
ncbi:uncharacterized protein METZ01_LOCUS299429, partial [marine metagenome]